MKNIFIALFLVAAVSAADRASAAGVLDQVPADAGIVLVAHHLDQLSARIAKFAQGAGFADSTNIDPLKSLEKSMGVSKGINPSGDLAGVLFPPFDMEKDIGDQSLILFPVSDYKAFITNFANPKEGADGITSATEQETKESLYFAHWGDYAAIAKDKSFLAKKQLGLKLQGAAADEFTKRDMAVYLSGDTLRALVKDKLKGDPGEIADEWMAQMPTSSPQYKPFVRLWITLWILKAQQFVQQTQAGALGIDVAEDGVFFTAVAEFKPGSKLAAFADSLKGTGQPMLAGLPDEPYALLGGSTFSPQMQQQIIAMLIDPLAEQLDPKDPSSKSIGQIIDAMRGIFRSTERVGGGLIPVPQAAEGKSNYRIVRVISGPAAPAIKDSYEDLWHSLTDLVSPANAPATQPAAMTIGFKPEEATIAGTHFDLFSLKIDDSDAYRWDKDEMLVGRHAFGGWIGQASPQSVVIVTGVTADDPLLRDALAAAQAGKDVLGSKKLLGASAAHLPADRPWEMFGYARRLYTMSESSAAPVDSDESPFAVSFSGAGGAGGGLRVDFYIPATEAKSMNPFAAAGVPETMPATMPTEK